jgi:hypothetical protein
MLKETTIQTDEKRCYEEPDGEIIELLENNSRTITFLVRVDDEKGGGVSAPFAPSDMTVIEVKDALKEREISGPEASALLGAERDEKNRTTAKNAIKEFIPGES